MYLTSTFWRRFTGSLLLALACCLGARAQSTPPAWLSAVALDGLSLNVGAAAFDAAGNLHVLRGFDGSVNISGTTFTSNNGSPDILVLKYSPTGTLLWARQISSPGADEGFDLALDPAGNVYVAGAFRGSVSLAPNVSLVWNGGTFGQGFVVCFSAQGTPRWAQQSVEDARVSRLRSNGNGQLCLVGFFYGQQLTMGGVSLPGPAEATAYIGRLSEASGAVQSLAPLYSYAATGTASASVTLPRLALSPGGEAYVSIAFPPNTALGFPNLTAVSRGNYDVVLAKYNAQNGFEWARQIGGTGNEYETSLRVDAGGSLYLVGYYDAPFTLGPSVALTHAGGTDGYLAKYSPQGTLLWAQAMGGSGNDLWRGVTIDGAGTVYTTGSFSNTVPFGAQTLSSAGDLDAVIASYSPAGQVRWAQRAGGPNSDEAITLGFEPGGGAYVRGRFVGSCTFGATTISSPLISENFIARLGTLPLAGRAMVAAPLTSYPNPAHDQLHLPALPAGARLQIVDALGRSVRETQMTPAATVSVRGLRPGLYSLRATDARGHQYAGRVVVE